jgi:organic hydroperoxide reductase OsmC/OhrA
MARGSRWCSGSRRSRLTEHKSTVVWNREHGAPFTDNRYSRGHCWLFDGGIEIPASSSPHVVPVPLSVAAAVDPEEAFVASLSSCHMLWFLFVAAKRRFVVDSYLDEAVGVMGKDEAGKMWMTSVTLRPKVQFSGAHLPATQELAAMHHAAHEECFIARSVKTDVRCEPVAT